MKPSKSGHGIARSSRSRSSVYLLRHAALFFLLLVFAVISYAAVGTGPGKGHAAPEVDPASALSALTLLTGAVLLFRARRR